MAKYLSQAEYARHAGHSRQYINKLVQNGVIKTVEGKINPEHADKAIEDSSSPAHKRGRSLISYKDAQTAKEISRAKLAQIQVREKEGELIKAADVERVLIDLFNTIKTRIRAIPIKTAQEVAALKTAKKSKRELMAGVRDIVGRECDEALEELSSWEGKK